MTDNGSKNPASEQSRLQFTEVSLYSEIEHFFFLEGRGRFLSLLHKLRWLKTKVEFGRRHNNRSRPALCVSMTCLNETDTQEESPAVELMLAQDEKF